MQKEKVRFRFDRETLLCLPVLLGIAVLAFVLITLLYQRTFLPHTWIEGMDCGSMTAEHAAEQLYKESETKTLTLVNGDGREIAVLPLSRFIDRDSVQREVSRLLEEQRSRSGVFSWLITKGENLGSVRLFTEEGDQIEAITDEMIAAAGVGMKAQDAVLTLGETGYTLTGEIPGTEIDRKACVKALGRFLPTQTEIADCSLTVPNGYLPPEITADKGIPAAKRSQLDRYLDAEVTLDFGNDSTYTLTSEDIWSVSDFAEEKYFVLCKPDYEKALPFVSALADAYADDGVYAKFRNVAPTRELIYYRVGDDGWILDRERLAQELCDALAAGGGTVTMHYDYTWYWNEYYWYAPPGDTFVEISLDNQYLWYYLDGELLVETPVVTGWPDAGDETRRGYFHVYGMVDDTYLVGPTWYDHVDYWMPFDGQIGMHDSSWRSEYGGNIYLEQGSHGCVNTPLEAVGTIYENIWEGVPVIVY